MNIVEETRIGAARALKLGWGPLGRPMMCVTLYRAGNVLIDTGQRRMKKAVTAYLQDTPPVLVCLTHHHEDHSGNAALIAERFNASIIGHPVTMAKMADGFTIKPYQHLLWGRSAPAPVRPLPRIIDAGAFRFVPVPTPGHSRDHTAYLDTEHGLLFSGDLYLGDRIKYFRSDEDFAEQINSLKRVLRLDFESLCCGHNPVEKNGKERIRQKLAFLEELRGRVGQLHERGYSDDQIVKALDPGLDRMIRWVTMGNVSFANMVRSALDAVREAPLA